MCISFTGIVVAIPIFECLLFARNVELFFCFVFDTDVSARKRRSFIPHSFLDTLR